MSRHHVHLHAERRNGKIVDHIFAGHDEPHVAADRNVGLAAAVTYALGYTFELGLSLVIYFGGERRRAATP